MKKAVTLVGTPVFVGLALFLYFYIIGHWDRHMLDFLMTNSLYAFISGYLVVFLVILIFRYFALMVFSYLEHVESLKAYDEDEVPEGGYPFITIVVPAYNEGLVIQSAIRSLLELDYPNYEILVVDDGSTDDTFQRALEMSRLGRNVRVITKPNGGKADALNTGMAQARGDFILNMDGDAKLSRNTLKACIRHFSDPRMGAVAGNVKVLNRENVLTKVQALEYVEGLALARKAQSYTRSVNIIPGPLGLFRKSALWEVGGYDHDTFAEDCDLTLKLLFEGWHVVYEPTAIAWVESPSRLLDLLKQRYRWTRGILQAIRKHVWSLKHPIRAGINGYILWYMLFEGVIWPVSNVLGNVFFGFIGIKYGIVLLISFWWMQLSLLDMAAAAYCVFIEKEDLALIVQALFFRVFYLLIVDVAKIFASVEELFGFKMTWGKLDREGKL